MANLDIPNPIPVVEEAKAAKVFDKLFCTRLIITANPSDNWQAEFTGRPYDGIEILNKDDTTVQLIDLKSLAALDLELAQAMGAVLSVIGKYLVKCKITNKYVVTTENIQEILK